MDDEDYRAKQKFITAFHDSAEERIVFLQKLISDGREDEAMILCLSYIDSFSQWLEWPSTKSGQNFVNAVIKFGGDPFMSLVHPLQAFRAFDRMNSYWKEIASHINNIHPGPLYTLLDDSDFLSHLPDTDVVKVKKELWRTTIAGVAYYGMRNFAIHGFGATPLTFSNTSYKGQPVSGLDFSRLYKIVSNVHAELRRRSEATGQWFGNDKIVDS